MKPYQQIAIQDCGEPLVPLSPIFAIENPHPYVKLGAPYGDKSPYYLRRGVLAKLVQAQQTLQAHFNWRIQIFDAYRPVAVQQFMVDYTLAQVLQTAGLSPETLSSAQQQAFLEQVYQFWAAPSLNLSTPPPHSTGAAVDVTLVDAAGNIVEMGSPIDEMSPRSCPEHFATDKSSLGQVAHQNRRLLLQIMTCAGFKQHPQEWWHFSYGDQLWAWLTNQASQSQARSQFIVARYGRI
jgi:zinc D-Ala-D-Ala dipeptidase